MPETGSHPLQPRTPLREPEVAVDLTAAPVRRSAMRTLRSRRWCREACAPPTLRDASHCDRARLAPLIGIFEHPGPPPHGPGRRTTTSLESDYGPKVAVTLRFPVMVTAQVLTRTPEQAPLQPTKTDDGAGVAVSVTTVPLVYEAEQVAPQLTPAGLDVTAPLPSRPV